MRTLKLVIEYDGTALSGWQRQHNGPTVQEHLEDALSSLFGQPTAATGASRTDAGVHARGQVASVRTLSTIPTQGVRAALNNRLPDQIAVRSVSDEPDEFHARFSAAGKHYRYRVDTQPARSPLTARYTWHRRRPLDAQAMAESAKHLVGDNDFSAFRASGCSARTPNRRITSVELATIGSEIVIDIRGNAFLRNMVRIIAGTLCEVGDGRFSPVQVLEILNSRDRTNAGQTAPPQGLCLMEVFYPPQTPGTPDK